MKMKMDDENENNENEDNENEDNENEDNENEDNLGIFIQTSLYYLHLNV